MALPTNPEADPRPGHRQQSGYQYRGLRPEISSYRPVWTPSNIQRECGKFEETAQCTWSPKASETKRNSTRGPPRRHTRQIRQTADDRHRPPRVPGEQAKAFRRSPATAEEQRARVLIIDKEAVKGPLRRLYAPARPRRRNPVRIQPPLRRGCATSLSCRASADIYGDVKTDTCAHDANRASPGCRWSRQRDAVLAKELLKFQRVSSLR